MFVLERYTRQVGWQICGEFGSIDDAMQASGAGCWWQTSVHWIGRDDTQYYRVNWVSAVLRAYSQ